MNYIISIDETGSFNLGSKKNSFIGGVILKSIDKNKFKNYLKDIIKKWNNNNSSKTFNITYPNSLHFAELLYGENVYNKNNFNSKKNKLALSFITNFIQTIQNSDFLIETFKSSGFPNWYANEQQAYLELLKTTVYAIFVNNKKLFNDYKSNVSIIIATRKIEMLIGSWAKVNYSEYTKNIDTNLTKILTPLLKNKIGNISIKFDYANSNPFLIVSDFFIGNYKNKIVPTNQLNINCYNYNDYYFETINEPLKLFKSMWNNQNYSSAIDNLLFFILSSKALSKKNSNLFVNWISLFPADEQNEIISIFKKHISYLNNLSNTRGYKNDPILKASQKLQILYKLLNNIQNFLFTNDFYTLKADITKLLTSVESHLGKTKSENNWNTEYENLLSENGEIIYPNILDRLRNKIEWELANCQIDLFNKYVFDKIIIDFEEKWLKYSEICELINNSYSLGKDMLLAKISGNLGQAHGFVFETSQNNLNIIEARKYLNDDIANLQEYSYEWDHGLSFLIQLEWKFGNLDDAVNLFSKQINKSIDISDLKNIFGINALIDYESKVLKWHLSNQFRLLARCINENKISISYSDISDFYDYVFNNEKNFQSYPSCIIRKYLGYILIKLNKYDEALNILSEYKSNFGFTIKTLYIPNRLLYVFSLFKHHNNVSNVSNDIRKLYDSVINEIIVLRELESGFDKYLTQKNFSQNYSFENINNWNLYDTVCLPPFYYA